MAQVRVLVVRAPGTNCDEETVHAWKLAGAEATRIHVDRLAETPALLETADILTLPGGFSYGDDIGAGKVFARVLQDRLLDALRAHVERGGGILGVCNGFQVLVKAGLLPGRGFGADEVTVSYNASARFEARWVHLEIASDRCAFLKPGRRLEMPVEHGEGRVVVAGEETIARLTRDDRVALRYVDQEGGRGGYPVNPNGSADDIAGICDETGRIMGLMPHPERFFHDTQHPFWTRRARNLEPDGLEVYRNAVRHWR